MNEKPYPFALSRSEFRYEFVSVSPEKEVRKVVTLSQTRAFNIYNLALFDVLDSGNLSDSAESNNDDLRTVLATVIKIIEDFLNRNPECLIAFKGSDERRQRLYRIVISKELPEILKVFDVYGGTGNEIIRFQANVPYDFYLIEKL